jgi:hypothetical protein
MIPPPRASIIRRWRVLLAQAGHSGGFTTTGAQSHRPGVPSRSLGTATSADLKAVGIDAADRIPVERVPGKGLQRDVDLFLLGWFADFAPANCTPHFCNPGNKVRPDGRRVVQSAR